MCSSDLTVVILVGDPAQLGSVGAGGWFAHLVATSRDVPALASNQRQRGPALAVVRQALTDLRSPDPDRVQAALDRLAADGRLRVCADRGELMASFVTDWYADRQHAPAGRRLADAARMLAEHHSDVTLLNRAARTLLAADGTLHGPVLSVAGREFQAGDEVITLTQTGHTLIPAGRPPSAYVRAGSVGTVTAVHPDRTALTVDFPGKGAVYVDRAYLSFCFPDGRDGGLEHAYALSAHKAEGATLPVARALAVDDTSRAGLYVMLSRARTDLRAYLIRRADLDHHPDEETWLPMLDHRAGPLARLADRLQQSQPERLASAVAPAAAAAHPHRVAHTLAELTRLRQDIHSGPSDHGPDPILLRRAELGAEAAIAAAAPTDPPAELIVRIGPRPAHGPDRRVWDAAVAALAVQHARWQPETPAHQPGPEPEPGPDDDAVRRWRQQRRHARQIASAWAARLDPAHRRRLHSHQEAVHRQRAIAGIHALLDHGLTAEHLTTELTSREQRTTTHTVAAVLDHRVRDLLTRHRVDPAAHQIPPPASHRQDWQRVDRLLHAAETNHLAAQPTPILHAEHQHLTTLLTHHLTSPRDAGADLTAAHARLRLLDAALNRQIDHAAARFTHQPAGYLTAQLGRRPSDPARASTWDRHALAIEHHRHHVLGLGYGTDADTPAAPPSRQALGPPASDPVQRRQQARLAALQTTLDLGTGL